MNRSSGLIAIVALLGIIAAATVVLLKLRPTRDEEIGPRQWDFDRKELASLMDHVIDYQQAVIDGIANAAGRERAEAFKRYYEGRRARVSS
jgi:hypothetical protein